MNNESSFAALITPITVLCLLLGFFYVPCELMEKISSEFDDINDAINQFHWYLLPLQIRKMLPIVMMSSQETVGFECFGSFNVSRELFEKLVNCGFSYFMVLRRFG